MENLVNEAIRIIKNKYTEIHHVRDIAIQLNCSYNTLRKHFTHQVGIPIIQYLNKTKCFYASLLLKSTDWKLYAIALEVGYNDEKYFIKVFKKFYNKCPEQFRTTVCK